MEFPLRTKVGYFMGQNTIGRSDSLLKFLISQGLDPTFPEFEKIKWCIKKMFNEHMSDAKVDKMAAERTISIFKKVYGKDERLIIYIAPSVASTAEGKARACSLSFDRKFFEYDEIEYDRMSNGVNQSGTVTCYQVNHSPGLVISTDYKMILKFERAKQAGEETDKTTTIATLTLTDMSGLPEKGFTFMLDPVSLKGIGKDNFVVSRLLRNGTLDCFRVPQIKGHNHYYGDDGQRLLAQSENLGAMSGISEFGTPAMRSASFTPRPTPRQSVPRGPQIDFNALEEYFRREQAKQIK